LTKAKRYKILFTKKVYFLLKFESKHNEYGIGLVLFRNGIAVNFKIGKTTYQHWIINKVLKLNGIN